MMSELKEIRRKVHCVTFNHGSDAEYCIVKDEFRNDLTSRLPLKTASLIMLAINERLSRMEAKPKLNECELCNKEIKSIGSVIDFCDDACKYEYEGLKKDIEASEAKQAKTACCGAIITSVNSGMYFMCSNFKCKNIVTQDGVVIPNQGKSKSTELDDKAWEIFVQGVDKRDWLTSKNDCIEEAYRAAQAFIDYKNSK